MLSANQKNQGLNALNGAKFGLAVTLFAFLAACSHKPVEENAVDMTPVAANEEALAPNVGDETTPIPDSEALASTPTSSAPIAAPHHAARHKGVKAHKAKHARKHAARHGKKIVKHHAKKAVKKQAAAAVGQVQNTPPSNLTPPPAPVMPESTTTLNAIGTGDALSADADLAPSHRSWVIWSLIIAASIASLLVYRKGVARRSRGIVFNS